MRRLIEGVFAHFGTEAILHTASGEYAVRVLWGSVSSKSKQSMQTRYHTLGKMPKGQYICRFQKHVTVKEGDWVEVSGKGYVICRVEDMLGPGGCAYRWAICTGKGGEDPWM